LNKDVTNIWKVIINPHAGGCTDSLVWEQILIQLNHAEISFVYEVSEYPQHIFKIVQQSIIDGYRKFIIIGGDGSLNEAVNGINKQSDVSPLEITTAQIPLGTGNDWLKTHNLPTDSMQMIQKIKTENSSYQDIGFVTYQDNTGINTNYFINVAGMGFDAYVVLNTSGKKEKKTRSKFSYLFSLFRSLMSYKCLPARIYLDGNEVFYGNLFSFNVGIGKYNGGGMMQVPDAIPDDGLFDLTVFRKMSKFKVLFHVKDLYDGSFKTMKEVSIFRGKDLVFHSDHPISLECDGELLGHSPFTFSIIERGFRFIW